MARGRCSGCGHEDASSAKVRRHTAGCAQYARLYRERPELCFDPESEMARHAAEQESDEAQERKAEAKVEAVDRWREFQERRAEASRQRWASSTRVADGRGVPLSESEMADLQGAACWGEGVVNIKDRLDSGALSPRERVAFEAFAGK